MWAAMTDALKQCADRLERGCSLTLGEYGQLIRLRTDEAAAYLAQRADRAPHAVVTRQRRRGCVGQAVLRGEGGDVAAERPAHY